ncbi:iron-sulfur cluster co-chaperone protein HscB isoform X3 [Phyllopteryx taeniolatus]|uniref:iron-sulfur cluster co-chaperone protein HscB isoform X3 n=1 Tax=Phyllopteryx taeniolatus TaxID=161469 RepID=UPI002AD39111|nr:iron-sulfur cluster co-chaperone protein HscB isoform X3 [Phyllopteryx taeniolatus]
MKVYPSSTSWIVKIHLRWTCTNFRKDTCSSNAPSIQTTSARNLRTSSSSVSRMNENSSQLTVFVYSKLVAREQEEREYSEHQSALVNKAYRTLLKPLSRGLYMLELKGMRFDEGTESGVDAEFLMELMEINEALEQAQTPEEADKISQDTKGKLKGLTEKIDGALRAGELQAAKALLAQMKYFSNIEEKVKEKLSGFM